MIKFEVGTEFPLHNRARGVETNHSSFNESFFDILYYIKNPSTKDIHTFRKESMKYGLFESQNVPFLLIQFKSGWNFDCSINILKAQQDKVEDWLNAEYNAITMYLIDADTNKLLGMRLIGIQTKISEEIRDVLDNQLKMYNSAEKVDAIILSVMNHFTTDQMLSRTKMIAL